VRGPRIFLFAAFLASLGSWPVAGALGGETILIRARKLYPVSRPPIENGVVLVRGGKIAAVGAEGSEVILPAGEPVRVYRAAGSLVPGFIDASSDIAVRGRAAEEFRELTPEMRVLDAVDLEHPELESALRSGVTAVAVSPGGRNVIGGMGAVLRTARTAAGSALLKRDAFLDASLSEEASSGNVNLRFSRPSSYIYRLPNTRMGTVFLLRRAFMEALAPEEEAAGIPARLGSTPGDEPSDFLASIAPARMLLPEGKAALRRSLKSDPPLRVWADYQQEVITALRTMDEFKAHFQLLGAAEAMNSIPELAAKKVEILLYAGTNFREESLERFPRYSARLPALLADAGIPFAFFSRSGAEVPLLRSRVALSLRFGLSEEKALEALTLGAAKLLGVESRAGSIEPGKEADLVALSGGPLDITAEVEWVMVGGDVVYEAESLGAGELKQTRSF
jgi:imidazolonepropionase-like amidohydrolase